MDGQYFIPRTKDSTSKEEMEEATIKIADKPWAIVSYHKAYEADMVKNIIRGFLSAIIAAFFVCWVLMKQSSGSAFTHF